MTEHIINYLYTIDCITTANTLQSFAPGTEISRNLLSAVFTNLLRYIEVNGYDNSSRVDLKVINIVTTLA